MKRSVDKWDPYTAIMGGYETNGKVIWEFKQNKNTLYPATPIISCFLSSYSYCEAIGSLSAEKSNYEWDNDFLNNMVSWVTRDCIVTSEDGEYICTESNIITQ